MIIFYWNIQETCCSHFFLLATSSLIFREGNGCADKLSNHGYSLQGSYMVDFSTYVY